MVADLLTGRNFFLFPSRREKFLLTGEKMVKRKF